MTRREVLILGTLTISGVLTLVWARVESSDDFLGSFLIEVGAAIFLFAGLYLLETRYLGKRVTEVELETERLAGAVEDVRTEVREARAALDEVGHEARSAIKEARAADRAALARLEQDVSRESVLDLLHRARRLNAISEGGVRVKVGLLSARLAFQATEDSLDLSLQAFDGEQIDRFNWNAGVSPAKVMAEVAEGLVRINEFHERAFDASEVFEALRDAVEIALATRWGERPPTEGLGSLIEVPNDQWAVTEDGLECLERNYVIDATRVDEPDWRSHMFEKVWVDRDKFEEGYHILRALVTSDMNPYFSHL